MRSVPANVRFVVLLGGLFVKSTEVLLSEGIVTLVGAEAGIWQMGQAIKFLERDAEVTVLNLLNLKIYKFPTDIKTNYSVY